MFKVSENTRRKEKYEVLITNSISLLKQHEVSKAEQLLRRALFKCPDRPEAYNVLGALVECVGDWLNSQKFYRASLSIDPTYVPAWNNLNRVTSYDKRGSADFGCQPKVEEKTDEG